MEGSVIGEHRLICDVKSESEDVDLRTDLYALAAIAYRALTGLRPFEGEDMKRVLVKVVSHMPLRPGRLVSVNADVDAFFALALAKEPTDRFASPEALSDALEAALRGELPAAHRARAAELLAERPWHP